MGRKRINFGQCFASDCERLNTCQGLCRMHYLRFKRFGRLGRHVRKFAEYPKYPSEYTRKFTLASMHKKRFGGLREYALKRDEFKCLECGMTNEEHKSAFKGRSLTINHVDGRGRYSPNPNNKLENLETLCLRCHGHKDGVRGSGRGVNN